MSRDEPTFILSDRSTASYCSYCSRYRRIAIDSPPDLNPTDFQTSASCRYGGKRAITIDPQRLLELQRHSRTHH